MKMGYQTVMNVPTFRNYNEAAKRLNNTKPIKGREPVIVPLGDRRDCDKYSIRKSVWTDAIECVLYTTPVVKFTVEDEVIINIGKWPSASTCQFISRILWNVNANRVRGDVVLHFNGGTKALVEQCEELVLVRAENGAWMPKEKQTLYDYRVNRKEANNVRKSVSQFRDYLAGVVKLKAETHTYNEGTYYETTSTRVKASYTELIEVFGCEEERPIHGVTQPKRFRPDVDAWDGLSSKPRYYHIDSKADMWAQYRDKTAKFFDLVRDDQDDNCRHQNYWLAFNVLFVQEQRLWWRDDVNCNVLVNVDAFEKHLDKILFTMFSDKVFKRVALAEGKVPTGKYESYVMSEED
jgi:hypothetical protein